MLAAGRVARRSDTVLAFALSSSSFLFLSSVILALIVSILAFAPLSTASFSSCVSALYLDIICSNLEISEVFVVETFAEFILFVICAAVSFTFFFFSLFLSLHCVQTPVGALYLPSSVPVASCFIYTRLSLSSGAQNSDAKSPLILHTSTLICISHLSFGTVPSANISEYTLPPLGSLEQRSVGAFP